MTSSPARARPGTPNSATTALARGAGLAASGTLLAIGGLHVLWGAGSSWPLPDRRGLAEAVLGVDPAEARDPDPGSGGSRPSAAGAAACYAVAAALGFAAAALSVRPARGDRTRRRVVAVVSLVLAARGGLGAAGRTDLVSPLSTGARFRRLDRRYYAPLCLALSALTAVSLRRSTTAPRPADSTVVPPSRAHSLTRPAASRGPSSSAVLAHVDAADPPTLGARSAPRRCGR